MFKMLLSKGLSVFIAVFLSFGILTDVQAQEVRGTVVTSDGQPLPGVNIIIQDTDRGTVTDVDGNYQLSVPSLNETLVFSFIGHARQVIAIDGRTQINVEMESLAIVGEEMVVTAFGIQREARGLTYSTQGVSTERITQAREMNVINSLQGQVAGLNINRGATGVGGDSRVVLRGNRSISGDSQPLYIVDGTPIRGGIGDINPDDIASIDVLKGPNAAALYGSRAQNGAIIITTHRGEAGVVNVSFSNTFQVEDPIISTRYQNVYGQGGGGEYSRGSEFNWGPRMEGQQVAHWSPDPSRSGETYAFNPQPNNVRDAFRSGFQNTSNLSASIGGARTQTVFSYTWTDAQGMVQSNDMNRHNLSIRVNSELTDGLHLDSRISYMRRVINNQLLTGENFANPLRHIYRLPRNISTQDVSVFEYEDPNGLNLQHFWNPGSNGGANPYWTMNRNVNEGTRERVITMASLRYDISDALSLMVRGSYDGAGNEFERKDYNNSYIIANSGRYTLTKSNALEWNSDFLLSYAQDITDDWSLDANVGGNILQRRNNSLSSNTGPALTIPNFFTLSNTQNIAASHSIGSPMDVYSLYAFGQIGWRDAIYLDVTARNDWSSTLPADNRSYFYPSVGLSVILSDLIPAFPEFFTFTRVRASYAEVGNSASPFSLQRTASFSAGGQAGFLTLSGTLPNPDLRPEMTKSYEIGLDARFFGGRLGLDLTAYQTNTLDQLFTVALPIGSGASQFFTNGGDVENKGIEVLLNATPVQAVDFRWDMNVNFATNRNMVVAISDERPRLNIGSDFLRDAVIEEGQPFGQVYSRGWVRDDQGRVVVDPNGMPQLTAGKTVAVANLNPDWTGGISSTFSYRNYSFSFLIDHRQGGSIASLTNAIMDADGLTHKTLQGRDGSLVFGDNFFSGETAVQADAQGNPTNTPNAYSVDAETFWRAVGGRNAPVGEAFVEEATNTRVREMTVSYRLPQSVMASLPVSNISVSLVGRNLFFIYKASETLDPDLMVGTSAAFEGFESFTPPTARTIGANIKIDF